MLTSWPSASRTSQLSPSEHILRAGRSARLLPAPVRQPTFSKTLPNPVLYEAIKNAERIADITHHRFPTSVWRYYERLPISPYTLLVVGL